MATKEATKMVVIPVKEWKEKAKKLFGPELKQWKFKCASCGETQTAQDFIDNKVKDWEGKFYFSCIGRWVKGRGCDWTLGGLFQIHKTEVINEDGEKISVFEFAKNE